MNWYLNIIIIIIITFELHYEMQSVCKVKLYRFVQ